MAEATFYRCDKCSELVYVVERGHCVPQCCGEQMRELEAGVVEAATEKHVPAVFREGDAIVVQVGEVAHPMLEEHLIQWVALVTDDRCDIRYLRAGSAPKVSFAADGLAHATVYAYCNLHGLWKAEV